jgi:hypothetical protein
VVAEFRRTLRDADIWTVLEDQPERANRDQLRLLMPPAGCQASKAESPSESTKGRQSSCQVSCSFSIASCMGHRSVFSFMPTFSVARTSASFVKVLGYTTIHLPGLLSTFILSTCRHLRESITLDNAIASLDTPHSGGGASPYD